MMILGKRRIKCPRCGDDIIVDYLDEDYVHKCVKSDGTRLTSRNIEDHPGLILTNTDNLESAVIPPWNSVKWSNQKARLRNEKNVDTYIDLKEEF